MRALLLSEEPLLTTGSTADPLLPKLIRAINHATEIEISVSFVQPSGLELLLPALNDALDNGARLSILTSDYLLINSPKALRQLLLLAGRGAAVKLFCCGQDSHFHMKAYIFVRGTGNADTEGCAYIGSNNISRTALTLSHEWTLRYQYQGADEPADFAYIRSQFAVIFSHVQSQRLDEPLLANYTRNYQAQRLQNQLPTGATLDPDEDIAPNDAQEQALLALAKSRKKAIAVG